MLASAYDRWKTALPPYRLQNGDCLQCGAETEWVTGRALLARKVLLTPKQFRSAMLDKLAPEITGSESYCACCGSEALRVKVVRCVCGARTSWQCRCQ
jgi:hypothetical protein